MQPHKQDQIIGILLAAGKGRRFDPSGAQNKLLQTTSDGKTVALAAAAAMLGVLPVVAAVVRDADDALAIALEKLGCKLVICPDADQGMATSLVSALNQYQDADGWLIALGDMPHIQSSTIEALATQLRNGADIVAPFYQGERGNPIGFSARHLAELLLLSGDQGARALLKTHPVTRLDVDDPGIHYDVDTPADLATPN